MASAAPPEIFDRRTRRLRRDRAALRAESFLQAHIAEELLARLDMVTRTFATALLIGGNNLLRTALAAQGIATISADAGFRIATAARGVQCDEDRLPFADASVDLVLWPGGLDSVNDVPGALTLIRRILRLDGLFLAAFVGGGSLPRLRAAMFAADFAVHGGAAARIHPQIDIRSAGDLLQRAGFALPVIDDEPLDVRYGALPGLIADLRDAGATNLLADAPALTRIGLGAALADFAAAAAAADGRVTERVELVYLSGWSPGPDQPRPARPGSATASLADALARKP